MGLPWSGAKGLPLSGAQGHDDGGRPDAGLPTGESGDGNGESEVGYRAQASLPDEPTLAPSPRKAQKRANFRGNKATMLFRMSDLIQTQPKNKPNLPPHQLQDIGRQSWPPKNKAMSGCGPSSLPCHSERSEESRCASPKENTGARFFAPLRMTCPTHCPNRPEVDFPPLCP